MSSIDLFLHRLIHARETGKTPLMSSIVKPRASSFDIGSIKTGFGLRPCRLLITVLWSSQCFNNGAPVAPLLFDRLGPPCEAAVSQRQRVKKRALTVRIKHRESQ